jgi:glycosyltransferase involved in cell wall biosynthesis
MPQVSVIIPTYNRPALLSEAIGSVLQQTYEDLELIIVDDGSGPETGEVISAVRDARVVAIRQSNAGLAAARNAGIRAARGEFVAFLDDDDTFLPKKLELQVPVLRDNPATGLVAGRWIVSDEIDGTVQERPESTSIGLGLRDWLLHCEFVPNVPLLRTQWAVAARGFNTSLWIAEDWDFWIRLAGLGCKMEWLDAVVSVYRIHNQTQMMSSANAKYCASEPFLLNDFFGESSFIPQDILADKDYFYAVAYLSRALLAIKLGKQDVARSQMVRALALHGAWRTTRSRDFDHFVVGDAKLLGEAERDQFLERVAELIPLGGPTQRRLEARLAMSKAFAAFARGDLAVARRALFRALGRDMVWLRNRGVMSMLVQCVLGGGRSSAMGRRR